MPDEGDLYGVLGLSRNASTLDIRRAYRRLARRHHPDRNSQPDGPARFRALADAYAVLSDPSQRVRYDRVSAPAPGAPDREPRPAQPTARGVLELSTREARLAMVQPLTLSDRQGVGFVLPAGVRDGDVVTLKVGAGTAVLTIRVTA